MRRLPLWLLLAGAVVVIVGITLQAFSIAAYVRGAGAGALDMHQRTADAVFVGEALVVIGAVWTWWGRWAAVGLAVAFLGVSVGQLLLIGDTDESGGWVNGLHGLLALVLLISALAYALLAARKLGLGERATISR
jgi:hypothetical protein